MMNMEKVHDQQLRADLFSKKKLNIFVCFNIAQHKTKKQLTNIIAKALIFMQGLTNPKLRVAMATRNCVPAPRFTHLCT